MNTDEAWALLMREAASPARSDDFWRDGEADPEPDQPCATEAAYEPNLEA